MDSMRLPVRVVSLPSSSLAMVSTDLLADAAHLLSGGAGLGQHPADGRLRGVPPVLRALLGPQRQAQDTVYSKPTSLYLEENGKYKSYEPEPIDVTVRELGIKGWIKG